MKLVTFQPKEVYDTLLKNNKIYVPKYNERLGQNVFCIKFDENSMENVYLTAPSMPQIMLILDIDDKRVEEIDYIQWVNKLNGFYTEENSEYKEYKIKEIRPEDVIFVEIISESDDVNKVQDDFMDKHLFKLEKMSGKQWYRANDEDFVKFWSTPQAIKYVNTLGHCMMPQKILTEKDLKKAHRLVREIFIKV